MTMVQIFAKGFQIATYLTAKDNEMITHIYTMRKWDGEAGYIGKVPVTVIECHISHSGRLVNKLKRMGAEVLLVC
jgi:hypothetical protein